MKATVYAHQLEADALDGVQDNTPQGMNNATQKNGTTTQEKESDQKSDQKSDQIHAILELIKNNPKISRAELSEITGLHSSSVKRRLKILTDNGMIERIGPDKGGYWKIKIFVRREQNSLLDLPSVENEG